MSASLPQTAAAASAEPYHIITTLDRRNARNHRRFNAPMQLLTQPPANNQISERQSLYRYIISALCAAKDFMSWRRCDSSVFICDHFIWGIVSRKKRSHSRAACMQAALLCTPQQQVSHGSIVQHYLLGGKVNKEDEMQRRQLHTGICSPDVSGSKSSGGQQESELTVMIMASNADIASRAMF